MNNLNKFIKSFKVETIDRIMVASLYALSIRSVIATIFLSFLLTYYFYPVLEAKIVWWNFFVILVSLIRLYLANTFHKKEEKYHIKTWYYLFIFLTFFSALLFSILGFGTIFYVDDVHQIFIIAILLGFTSGAMNSLSPDVRIVIGYLSIIFLPLIAALATFGTTMHMVLVFLAILYLVMQIIVILNAYSQGLDIELKKEKIYKEQLKIDKKEEALEYFFEQAPIGVFSYDLELNVTDCNRSFLELFGLQREDIIGRNLEELPDKRPMNTIRGALSKGIQRYVGPYRSLKGLEFWVEAKCFPIYKEDNTVIGGIGLLENKTKEHTALKDLKHLAQHDPLTSLLNRRGLKEYMYEFMQKEEHSYLYSILIYLDLNKFKHINDSLGHKVGDKLLISISNRLKIYIKDACLVSRFGGDEFIVVSPLIAKSMEDAEKESKDCIDRIQKAFNDTFTVDDMNLSISTSLGVVIIEPHTSNIDEIIRYADIALYQAKKSTTDYTSFYDTKLDKERKQLFILQHDLGNAGKNKELKFYLQPLVTMKEDKLVAAECLLRWEHPELGLLYPNVFIPMAIETGLISDVTWWIIKEVCSYISELKRQNIWNLDYISINVNAKQLLLNHFVEEFLEIIEKNGLKTSDVMIEITERSIIDNFEDTQDIITALRNKGVKCAIDDFGIGYSSLSYLKKLSFDTLKIDMEFIKDIENRPDDIILVKTILEIGKQYHYHIVVEGIEEEKQKELLLEIDEDLIYQGYFFSKAIPCEVFTEKYLEDKI